HPREEPPHPRHRQRRRGGDRYRSRAQRLTPSPRRTNRYTTTRDLIDDPHRFEGVTTIGVDEHVWRHTRRGDRYVTVIIDLTPVRENRGAARLLDMIEGRSKQVFSDWLAARTPAWRAGIEVVAMDR